MRNKEKQEFLVPINQLLRQWRRQEMLVSSTSKTETSKPVSPTPEFDPTLVVLPDEVRPKLFRPKFNIGGWTVFWLSLTVIMSATSIGGYWLLTTPPTTPDCQKSSSIVSSGEKLYCAQQKAESGKLKDIQAGVAFALTFDKDAPLYNEAQRLIGEWSLDLLRFAQQKVDEGDLKGATAIVKQIPTNSVSYKEVSRRTKRWQKQWEYGSAIEKEFQAAIKTQRWQVARSKIESLYESNSNYWRVQTTERLLSQLAAEKQGWQLLKTARKTASYNRINYISTAIAVTNRIRPQTHAQTLAKSDRHRWSQVVLKEVASEYQQQDFAKAIALAKIVPKDVPAGALAKDWMALSQASLKAKSKKDPDLAKALAVVRQIRPQSPLYKQAQAKVAAWKQQLQS